MDRREFIGTLAGTVAAAQAARGVAAPSATKSAESKPELPKRPLGRTGLEVTCLALGGVVGMIRQPSKGFHPAEFAGAAIDAGIKYLDTAPAYGNGLSETNYGELLAQRRKEVFLATKTGSRTYDGAMRDIEASLKRLRTDRVDLLQIHGVRTDEDLERWGKPDGVYTALQKLRGEKVTRFLGVTGHDSADMMRRAIEMYEFDTILTTFNPTTKRQPFEELVLPVAQKKKMAILAMKVMGGGVGSLAAGNPIKNDGASNHDDAAHQADPAMLIRYVLGLPISVAIVGMGSLEQLRANIGAARDLAPLNEAERQSVKKQIV